MTDTTAKIRSKGLDGTGFTEDLAASLFTRVGHHLKAIIELQVVDKHGPNLDGKRGIELVITHIEVADDPTLDEHLGDISQALYTNRKLDGHTGTTTAGQERTVADVLSSGGKFKPHPFLPVDAADDNGICDICGVVSAAGPHSTQDTLGEPDTEEEDTEAEEPDDEATAYVDTEGDLDDVDPYFFVHAKGGNGEPGVETPCGLRATIGKSLQLHEDREQVTCQDCIEALDARDIDASFHGDNDEPWEYPAPEGVDTVSTIPDPFAAASTT